MATIANIPAAMATMLPAFVLELDDTGVGTLSAAGELVGSRMGAAPIVGEFVAVVADAIVIVVIELVLVGVLAAAGLNDTVAGSPTA